MSQKETENHINIPLESLNIHNSKNILPEWTFSVNTLSKYISNSVSATLDQLPGFRALSNHVALSLEEIKGGIEGIRSEAINQTTVAIENTVNTYNGVQDMMHQLGEFLGKIPKSTYDNMKLAISNFQKNSELQNQISNISTSLGIDPYIICGICTQETKFNPNLISPRWARGLMQLMPNTERGIRRFIERGSIKNAWPEERFYASLRENKSFMELYNSYDVNTQNLSIGSAFISYLNKKFWWNIESVLRYYNGGWSVSARNSQENRSYAPWAMGYAKLFQEMNIFGTV